MQPEHHLGIAPEISGHVSDLDYSQLHLTKSVINEMDEALVRKLVQGDPDAEK